MEEEAPELTIGARSGLTPIVDEAFPVRRGVSRGVRTRRSPGGGSSRSESVDDGTVMRAEAGEEVGFERLSGTDWCVVSRGQRQAGVMRG